MFSNSHLLEKQADREMIAAATAEFYARGGEEQVLAPGKSAQVEGQRCAPQLVLDPVKHEQNSVPKRQPRKSRPRKEIEANTATPKRLASIKIARDKLAEQARQKREELAVKIIMQAALGDSRKQIAAALGISRDHLRLIAKEFNIQFKTQA